MGRHGNMLAVLPNLPLMPLKIFISAMHFDMSVSCNVLHKCNT